jgi:hypothetical protein
MGEQKTRTELKQPHSPTCYLKYYESTVLSYLPISGYKIKKRIELEADHLLRSTAKLDRINLLLYLPSHTPCAQGRAIAIRKH